MRTAPGEACTTSSAFTASYDGRSFRPGPTPLSAEWDSMGGKHHRSHRRMLCLLGTFRERVSRIWPACQAMAPQLAEADVLVCCACESFAQAIARAGPYADQSALITVARRVWWTEVCCAQSKLRGCCESVKDLKSDSDTVRSDPGVRMACGTCSPSPHWRSRDLTQQVRCFRRLQPS